MTNFKRVFVLIASFVAFLFIIVGADYYIKVRYHFPYWLEVVFNILSLIFAIGVGAATFMYWNNEIDGKN